MLHVLCKSPANLHISSQSRPVLELAGCKAARHDDGFEARTDERDLVGAEQSTGIVERDLVVAEQLPEVDECNLVGAAVPKNGRA